MYPPFFAKSFNENLPTVDDEFGLFPHVGFGWVKRGATAAGWQTRLWDAAATKQSLDELIEEIVAWGPDLVGFSGHAAQTIVDIRDDISQELAPWAKSSVGMGASTAAAPTV